MTDPHSSLPLPGVPAPSFPTEAVLTLNDGRAPIRLNVIRGTEGAPAIDTSALYKTEHLTTYDPGFQSTSACRSAVSFVDGEAGCLTYRGYPIEELAARCDFLQVAALLLKGELPNAEEMREFRSRIVHHTMVHQQVSLLLNGFRRDAHPMSILVGLIGALAAFYPLDPAMSEQEQHREAALMMIAKMPTLVAMSYRYSMGWPLEYPDNRLSYAANFLKMMFALPVEPYEPKPAAVKAVDTLFILHAEHEQNASTSTVRLCASAGANPYQAVAAGVACLSGPRHGGANESALRMLEGLRAAGGVKAIPDFIRRVKAKEMRLIGFGHRVYKHYDPRARIIRNICHELIDELGLRDDPTYALALELERIALEDDYFIERHLYPNVDFYSGIVQRAIGIPTPLFTAIFAIARTVGWFAQKNELLESDDLRLARPRQVYTGSPLRHLPETLP